MTFLAAITHGRKVLQEAGIEDFKQDAWYLMEYVCKIDRDR